MSVRRLLRVIGAVVGAIGVAMLLGWLYFFFGLFMSHGPVA